METAFVRFIRDLSTGMVAVFALLGAATRHEAFAFLCALTALSGAMAFLQLRAGRPRADRVMAVLVTLTATQFFTLDPLILEPFWVAMAVLGAIGGSFVVGARALRYHVYIGLVWGWHLFAEIHDGLMFFMVVQIGVYLLVALSLRRTMRSSEDTEGRYDSLFGRAPVAMWHEDFSTVAVWLEGLRSEGVVDLKDHLDKNRDLVMEAFGLVDILRVNDATVELLGATDPSQLLGPIDADSYRPETHESAVAQLLAMWNGEESVTTDLAVHTFDGREIDCALYWAAPMVRGRFDYSKVVVSTVDISSFKASERAAQTQLRLAQQERRLQIIAANAADLLMIVGKSGRVTWISGSVERLLGYEIAEFMARPIFDFVDETDAATIIATGASLEKGTISDPILHRIRHRDGTWLTFEATARNMLDDQFVDGFVISSRDVTDRVRVEEALLEAKDKAEAATATKSQFLANVSHEIRTPMNAILGMTELALGTDVSAEQREYLVTTRTAIDALITLINDLLDIAKIEAGKLELEEISFQLSDTIGDTLRTLAMRASEKGLALSHEIGPGIPDMLVGDPGRLRQVLFNLLGNALKFTHAGSVHLGAELLEQTDEAVELHLWVADTGIGIAADGLESIFEAFSQAEGSTTRRFGGTGLGLSISMQLVKMMQGRLWVESEPGEGSTFHFTVRLSPSSEEWSEAQGHDSATTVLVIADSEGTRRAMSDMLRLGGLHSLATADLAGALDIMFESGHTHPRPGAVLIDVRAGAPELARRLLKEPTFTDAPVVVVTPTGERGDAAVYRAAGVAGYLSKPTNPGELADVVAAVSGGMRPAGELVTRHWLRARRPKMNLLVADDSATNRVLATRLLEKRGHTVTVVETGREALELALAVKFDAILMDVQMPDMDGLEATTAIREKETGRIPIIGLTAHAGEADRQRCLAAGMDGFVSKPFRPEELFATVEQLYRGIVEIESIPRPAARPADLLDRFEALERLGGLPDLAVELMQEFQKEYPNDLELIRQAFVDHDLETVSRVAHRMKGSLGLLSAHPAAQAAALLERHGAGGATANAETAWQVLQEEMLRLEPVIDTLAGSEMAWA